MAEEPKKPDKKDEGKEKNFTPAGSDGGIGHLLYPGSPNCPKCGSPPSEHEVQNYDMMWCDGDVVCTKCGTWVRSYDAG